MTKEEFLKKWNEILDADSKKPSPSSTSRTFADSEAVKVGDDLWAFLTSRSDVSPFLEISQELLTRILIKTSGRYTCYSDQAEAIIKQLQPKDKEVKK